MLDEFPLIIDSFAGGGGASTGIERALGRSPDVAINHSEAALALHAANHPETKHIITSIMAVDPRDLVKKGQKVGLAWFSPDCKHFSNAKGSAPLEKNIRDLAWVVVHWMELVKPEVVMLENVREFKTWGPLRQASNPDGSPRFDKDGKPWMEPIPERKGEFYKKFCRQIRRCGYRLEWKELRACDYGSPTIRKRLFMVARCDGRPIVWPKPTHDAIPFPDGSAIVWPLKDGKLHLPEASKNGISRFKTAAECIDWSLPCPSVFDTKQEIKKTLGLTVKRPLVPNTMARIARGLQRYVLDAERPFIVNLTHGGRLEDAADPLRTITGANRGEKAAVVPSLIRHFGQSVGQRADMPAPTTTAGGGGKTGIIAPSITRFNGGATGQDMRDPMSTVTANSWIKKPGGATPLGMIAPSLMSLKGTARRDSAITALHPTVLAGGYHSALVAPVLTYAQQGGQVRDPLDPMHTICASRKDQNAALVPLLVQTGYGERKGQEPRCLDPHAPLGTIVAGGTKHAPAAAFLAQHNTARQGVNPGRAADTPISTITGAGSQQNVTASFFAKYYGTGDGARTDDPIHTITANDRFGHIQADMTTAPVFGPEHERKARMVADLMREHGYWDEREFVTIEINGETFVIVDVGMRMLTPRELYNAQGFPADYVIEGVWKESNGDWTWKPFPKDVQISCVGNSVCPDLAEALASANCQHLIEQRKAA